MIRQANLQFNNFINTAVGFVLSVQKAKVFVVSANSSPYVLK